MTLIISGAGAISQLGELTVALPPLQRPHCVPVAPGRFSSRPVLTT